MSDDFANNDAISVSEVSKKNSSQSLSIGNVVPAGEHKIIVSGESSLSPHISGGTAEIFSGGYMSGGSAAAGGSIAISVGAPSESLTVNSSGYVGVQSSASVVNIMANGDGYAVIEGGAYVSGAAAHQGESLELQSGASVTKTLHVNGGSADIVSGADVDKLVLNGGSVTLHPGGKIGQFVVSGGAQTIGGSVVPSILHVMSGAQLGPSVQETNGGNMNSLLRDSAPASDDKAAPSIGVLDDSGLIPGFGYGLVKPEPVTGYEQYMVADSSGILMYPGAQVNTISAINGGMVRVDSGAILQNLFISGGSVYFASGAIFGSSLPDGTRGGTIHMSGDYGHSGHLIVASGGSINAVSAAENSVVDLGGTANSVQALGTAIINFNDGAYMDAQHTAYACGIGAIMNVSSGAKVGNVWSQDGADVEVYSGANVSNITCGSDADMFRAAATVHSGATVSSVYTKDYGGAVVASGASVNKVTAASSGSALLESGATAQNLLAGSGGTISGGTLLDDSVINVLSGGTSIGVTITGGRNDGMTSDGHPIIDNTGKAGWGTISGSLLSATLAGATNTGGEGALLVVESGSVLMNTSMGPNARIKIDHLKYDDQIKNVTLIGNDLFITEGTGKDTRSWHMTLAGAYNPDDFTVVDDGEGNTVLVYACFLAGAMIRQVAGELPVEDVKAGDVICVLEDGQQTPREVKSVTRKRAVVRKDLPVELAGWPVQISKDAFAPGVPSQDLYVTPEHCFYLNGRFVPVRMLVNGASVRYDLTQASYEYYHIQMEPHAIIWANNTLTESYLETGARIALADQRGNEARVVALRELSWAKDAAAPLEVSRDFVEPLYREIRDRAYELGYEAKSVESWKKELTEEAELRVVMEDGTEVEPSRESNGKKIFVLPHRARTVRLLSRSFRPSSTIGSYVDDRRELGVLIGQIEYWAGKRKVEVTSHLKGRELPGWSVIEAGAHRWTTGNGLLPLPDCGDIEEGKIVLAIEIQAGGPYPVAKISETELSLSA